MFLMPFLSTYSKVVPVLLESTHIEIGTRVRIDNIDDDMHNSIGIFQGHFTNNDNEIRSLILLEPDNKNIYVMPDTLKEYI